MSQTLEHAIELALQLKPDEQAQLIKRVVDNLSNQIELPPKQVTDIHWGKNMIALLEQIETVDWEGIEDPVEWLKSQRNEMNSRLDWGEKGDS